MTVRKFKPLCARTEPSHVTAVKPGTMKHNPKIHTERSGRANSNAARLAILSVIVASSLLLMPSLWSSRAVAQNGNPNVTPPPPPAQLTPVFSQAVGFAESIAARDLTPAAIGGGKKPKTPTEERKVNELNEERVKHAKTYLAAARSFDTALQIESIPTQNIPAPSTTFDGLANSDNAAALGFTVLPSDDNIDVGPNHIVQTVNDTFRVFNKSGTALTPLAPISSLFAALGPPCGGRDDGDPVVLYDPLADRWLISQFCRAFNPNMHQEVAISKTGDPTGQYFLYDFVMPNNKFDDYPHYGVWPDAYYLTTNQFSQTGSLFLGGGAFALDRKKMLQGDPSASYIYFDEGAIDPSLGGELPSDIDGVVAPPAGTPNLFMEFRATEFGDPNDALRMFEFHADFNNPASSTFTQKPDLLLVPFDASQPSSVNAIEQPSPASPNSYLDALADRLMHRLAYRTLAGGVESYVLNFSVNVSGVAGTSASTYQTGIRWIELRRNPGTGAMTVNQQGTYAPGAGDGANGRNIWMGSVAQDHQGDIGLGFSASSLSQFPTVMYAGRLASDPAGTMGQGENTLFAGTGVQLHTAGRWGDYSSMSVDPADECTFWYTNQYYNGTSSSSWRTRIGNFKVDPACAAQPKGTIIGQVTDCISGSAIQNAIVTTPEGLFRQTDASGNYSMTVAPGTYNVTISKPGTGLNTCAAMVTVSAGSFATLNCCLQQAASCTINCPANVSKTNDLNQCGAIAGYANPTTGGSCGTVSCTPASGSFFPKGVTTVSCSTTAGPSCSFTVTVQDTQPPTIKCPTNISTAAGCALAVVSFANPAVSDNCPGVGIPGCSPASGSAFPKGITTVTCNVFDAAGNSASCSFSVTVAGETQPPVFTSGCPPNINVAAPYLCPYATSSQVNFANPVAADNCAGVTVACNPPSGSSFPVGATKVTCTATDTSNNTAACSFVVTVFSACLVDETNADRVVFFNAVTGEYRFCCGGVVQATGRATPAVSGCSLTIDHVKGQRTVHISVSGTSSGSGSAYIQRAGAQTCQITDKKLAGNSCVCP